MENPERVYDAATWIGSLSVHQDFFWFFSLLSWSLGLIAWTRHARRAAEWRWVPAAAGLAIATALLQFGIFNPTFDFFQDRLLPGSVAHFRPALVDPYWLGGVLIGVATAAMAAGWVWQAAREWRRPAWRVIAVAIGVVIAGIQAADAPRGGFLLGGWTMLAGGLLVRTTRGKLGARLGLLGAMVGPIFSTVGPVAAGLGLLQQAGPPTPMGLLAGGFQLVLGGTVGLGLAAGAWPRQHPETHAALRRDVRLAGAAAAVLLVAGLVFGIQIARDNRLEIQQNRLRVAAAQAKLFDPALLAPLTDRAFTIESRSPAHEPIVAYSPWLASGVATPLQRRLAAVVIATPFLAAARILVIHDGWLVAVMASDRLGHPGEVELIRRATAEDVAHWRDQTPYVETSGVHEIGYPYFCRAPIISEEGRMLGWLDCVRREYYLSVERRWRAGPFVMTALGIALLGLLVVQRQSGRERELARREAEGASAASRVKTAFLANVSHELRTPLQNILGLGEVLQHEVSAGERRAHLAGLQQQGELMLRLVNDLIDLSAVEAGAFQLAPRPTAPATLVRETVESLRARANHKGLALDWSVAPGVPEWVEVDDGRVRQVLLNLLGNALKFTERGGVRVTCSAAPAAPDRVRLLLEVSDTGPGIPPAEQARLFTAFSRLSHTAAHEGSGLGLAVAAALCRAMEGSLTVESDGRSGSRFTATLLVRGACAPATPVVARRVSASATRPQVLVVEDNVLMRDLFVAMLQARGAVCRSAATMSAALAAARAQPPEVVLMDLSLPDGDGLSRLAEWRAIAPDCRVIVASAHAAAAERERVLAAGAQDFLTKPVTAEQLWAAVGGAAPCAPELPDYAEGQPALREALREQFGREAAEWLAAAEAAFARRDFEALRRQAHYLRSSAIVVGEQEIFRTSGALEAAAAGAEDDARTAEAWRACRTALERWRAAQADKS